MPALLASRLAALEPFANRILAGEVVFFVGAGFSVDSEGLTAARLVQRLLLRLHVLDQLQPGDKRGDAFKQLAGLFGTRPTLAQIAADWANVQRLADRYYEVNEWMCRAYGRLLHTVETADDFHGELLKQENEARDITAWTEERFQPIPASWLAHARAAQSSAARTEIGKLLFVQTLGFHDSTVMGGAPFADLNASFAPPNLKPRHHILARFAREGFCPTLITTNFDLLLEAAFRLGGFGCAAEAGNDSPAPPRPDPAASLTSLQNFDVIASPRDFFEHGKAYRTATILKIHGCAGHLRHLACKPKASDHDPLETQLRYLPQLVYTYREIQHWRDDSWAADYLRTLLRTRAMVFSGYSTSDPVLHGTFRSIYEEMQRKRASADPANATPCADAARTPAYFLAYSRDDDAHEFHAAEILRSATLAVGGDADAHPTHPNYLRFRPSGRDDPDHPALDELLGWTQHRILRLQQKNALLAELPALIAALDRRRPASEITAVHDAFAALVAGEKTSLDTAPNMPATLRRLRHTLAWSGGFHLALRREWARGLLLTRAPGRRHTVADLENPLWYFPASERPAWTAWSAVVELALRNLARLAMRVWAAPRPFPSDPLAIPAFADAPDAPAIIATDALRPTVYLRRHAAPTSPALALTLQVRGFERPGKRLRLPGTPSRRVIWLFREDAVPWTQTRPAQPSDDEANADPAAELRVLGPDQLRAQPDASLMWRLALSDPAAPLSSQTRDLVLRLLPDWGAPLPAHA